MYIIPTKDNFSVIPFLVSCIFFLNLNSRSKQLTFLRCVLGIPKDPKTITTNYPVNCERDNPVNPKPSLRVPLPKVPFTHFEIILILLILSVWIQIESIKNLKQILFVVPSFVSSISFLKTIYPTQGPNPTPWTWRRPTFLIYRYQTKNLMTIIRWI